MARLPTDWAAQVGWIRSRALFRSYEPPLSSMDYSAPNRFPNAPAGHCSAVFVLRPRDFEALARDVRTNCARSLPARDAARLLDDARSGSRKTVLSWSAPK